MYSAMMICCILLFVQVLFCVYITICFIGCCSILEFVMRGHLFCLKVYACFLLLLLMVRCDSVLNVLRLLTALRWFCWRVCFLCWIVWSGRAFLIDVITTEIQFYNLLHVAIALFALQMTRQFTNSNNNCNRVLFVLLRNRLSWIGALMMTIT